MRANEFLIENLDLNSVVTDIVKNISQVQEIWLYGSRARGSAKPNSDWDILVIVPDNIVGSDFLDVQLTLDNLRKKFLDADIQASHSWGMLYRDAKAEGRKLWSRNRNQLTEGRAHPVIVVDVQPEYCGINDGDESPVCVDIIDFVAVKQTGPVLMFVNAEDMGQTGDTVASVVQYWNDTANEILGVDPDTYDNDPNYRGPINWNRFQIVDKGYGYLRSWMDHGIEPNIIIATIRELYRQRLSDSRDLEFPPFNQRTTTQSLIQGALDEMAGDPLTVNWTSVAQLKRFSGAYIVGGGRNECLREVELLMNAFNIRYKRIDSLVY